MSVPSLDRELGIEVYATKSPGVGGVIRGSTEDFMVEEVLVDGSQASIEGVVSKHVLGSTVSPQRFLLCVLVKRNWDTFIAVKKIVDALGVDQRQVQIAGIKDAKAVTAQHLTIEGVGMEDVGKFAVKDMQLRSVGYVREALSTFYLLGNSFTINIKGISFEESVVNERICKVASELQALGGIPNFYGHQRFGTTRPITHLVGREIVKGNFEEAAMLFLAKPSLHEHPSSKQMRSQLQETRDFQQALLDFPKQLRFERQMLKHLVEHPGDFVGAFRRLPMKLQALFVQAHQAYLFNRFLSARLNNGLSFGRVEVGDFVVAVERNGLPMVNVAKLVTEQTVTAVNEQVKSGRARVALPLVGLHPKLSQGVMGQIEEEVLAQEGIQLEGLRVNELSRVSGKGGLRTTSAPIRAFKFEKISETAGEGRQVQLSFMLLRGSYATVLLREIMKPADPISAGF